MEGKVLTSVHSSRLEPTKLISVGTRTTYLATGEVHAPRQHFFVGETDNSEVRAFFLFSKGTPGGRKVPPLPTRPASPAQSIVPTRRSWCVLKVIRRCCWRMRVGMGSTPRMRGVGADSSSGWLGRSRNHSKERTAGVVHDDRYHCCLLLLIARMYSMAVDRQDN